MKKLFLLSLFIVPSLFADHSDELSLLEYFKERHKKSIEFQDNCTTSETWFFYLGKQEAYEEILDYL